MRIAVFGLGSIGSRHARNLYEISERDVLCFDPRIGQMGFNPDIRFQVTNIPELIWNWHPEAVLICTPPSTHHALATEALLHGCHCFIEKPIGLTVLEANDLIWLNDDRQTLAVGYQLNACGSVRAFPRDWTILYLQDRQQMSAWPVATYTRDLLLEFSHELALCLLWAGAAPTTATADWHSIAHCIIRLSWDDGRSASIDLQADYAGYRRCAWSNRGRWDFSLDENTAAYVDEIEAFLVGAPYCTGEDALAVMQLIERLQP